MTHAGETRRRETRGYLIGYGLALLFTGAAFALVYLRLLSATAALGTILALALTQAVVHFHFFLRIGFKKSSRDKLHLLLFSALIILLMVSGTLVLLLNLQARMM